MSWLLIVCKFKTRLNEVLTFFYSLYLSSFSAEFLTASLVRICRVGRQVVGEQLQQVDLHLAAEKQALGCDKLTQKYYKYHTLLAGRLDG